jgi:hypothetical protein
MSSAGPKLPAATLADLLAIPENERFHEILDGELIRRAMPSLRHGTAQMGLADSVAGPYGPRSRGRGPGGWIFASEVEILFEPSQILRPDVSVRPEPFTEVELSVHGLIEGDEGA